MKPVAGPSYLDSGSFIKLFQGTSQERSEIRDLLKELRESRSRIYTSVLTIQETNVLSFRRGRPATDTTSEIAQFARIVSIDRRIALLAAQMEAAILDYKNLPKTSELSKRRKFDCMHMAAAKR